MLIVFKEENMSRNGLDILRESIELPECVATAIESTFEHIKKETVEKNIQNR